MLPEHVLTEDARVLFTPSSVSAYVRVYTVMGSIVPFHRTRNQYSIEEFLKIMYLIKILTRSVSTSVVLDKPLHYEVNLNAVGCVGADSSLLRLTDDHATLAPDHSHEVAVGAFRHGSRVKNRNKFPREQF